MGISLFSKSGLEPNRDLYQSVANESNGQPNPSKWKLNRYVVMNHYLIMDVTYDGCTNYEGRKILMFEKNVTIRDIEKQKVLDPHFSDSKRFIHPIARFVPTDLGWEMAIDFAISSRA